MKRERKGKSSAAAAVTAAELSACFEEVLGASRFADYCPNGLQVEGERPIRLLVSGVTASAALLRAAVREGADALLVHHGWFWRGEDPRVVGPRRERLHLALAHGLHLFAYHLPLDVHPQLGNNAQLGARMGWRIDGRAGEHGLIAWYEPAQPLRAEAVARSLARRLGRRPLAVGALERPIRRIAWCTGAAHDLLEQAIAIGADAFVSGEIAERTTHLAREAGVVYFAAGHHATERYGVQALGEHVAARLGLEHRFVDDDNPA
ncbi:MAG: Nif3-like dinuclear metal center hexameric protein [Burkholderiales bacterium]|nr:Nif3-like dinuclear metal center hexameric protein [Burkholderiales bacterium]